MAEFCVYESHGGICEKTGEYCNLGACAYEELKEFAPVVHGHWDCIPNQYMAVASKDGKYFGNATVCSVCHEVNPNAYKTNYCPNCGAKMDGGSDE